MSNLKKAAEMIGNAKNSLVKFDHMNIEIGPVTDEEFSQVIADWSAAPDTLYGIPVVFTEVKSLEPVKPKYGRSPIRNIYKHLWLLKLAKELTLPY